MKRNKLTRQVKTLSATAAVLLAFGLSGCAGIAAQTGGVNAYTEIGSGYHQPSTHDANANVICHNHSLNIFLLTPMSGGQIFPHRSACRVP